VPDQTPDRRKAWRHVIQCAIAEQKARAAYNAAEFDDAAAEARLLAEGTRLDAAIDALDEDLTAPDRRSA
jgi:isopentenyl diphosphate isomerase/L-lactate dehydrogenase-like FMN-dependent dehydrogenase